MKKLLIVAALLMAAACGGASDDDAADAIAESLTTDASLKSLGLDISKDDAQCVGDAWVKDIGTDKLEEYGVISDDKSKLTTTPTMDPADAKKAAAGLNGCIDLKETLGKVLADSAGLTGDKATCVTDSLNGDDVEAVFVAAFSGETPEMTSLTSRLQKCMTP